MVPIEFVVSFIQHADPNLAIEKVQCATRKGKNEFYWHAVHLFPILTSDTKWFILMRKIVT